MGFWWLECYISLLVASEKSLGRIARYWVMIFWKFTIFNYFLAGFSLLFSLPSLTPVGPTGEGSRQLFGSQPLSRGNKGFPHTEEFPLLRQLFGSRPLSLWSHLSQRGEPEKRGGIGQKVVEKHAFLKIRYSITSNFCPKIFQMLKLWLCSNLTIKTAFSYLTPFLR